MKAGYEMVIGCEVHVELGTQTKIFCGCSTAFGAEPNTQCCPVCMGMPGTLPVLNQKVVEYAVKAGLATNCQIASFSKQDRKNYFYPDLPKAYQISQYDLPLCEHGHLDIETAQGCKRIGITRIHIEEDAGKLVHKEGGETLCDYNRCGVPLIEIVSEPDMRSAAEVDAYLKKLRAIMLYTGVSDCKMQEGSFRCDVNLSVRRKGEQDFGTRTEMKNLNSFQYIGKAIAYEFERQVALIEEGGAVEQETRRFDQSTGKTYSMRSKEDAQDYRYFPDPDLPPIVLDQAYIQRVKESITALPDERKKKYIAKYQIAPADAEALVADREIADYFERVAELTGNVKTLSHLFVSELFRLLDGTPFAEKIKPVHLAELVDLLSQGRINGATAKRVLSQLWECDEQPKDYIERLGLWQISDEQKLRPIVQEVLTQNPKSVSDYRGGKVRALQMLIGQAMGRTQGKGDPSVIRALLEEELAK